MRGGVSLWGRISSTGLCLRFIVHFLIIRGGGCMRFFCLSIGLVVVCLGYSCFYCFWVSSYSSLGLEIAWRGL